MDHLSGGVLFFSTLAKGNVCGSQRGPKKGRFVRSFSIFSLGKKKRVRHGKAMMIHGKWDIAGGLVSFENCLDIQSQ